MRAWRWAVLGAVMAAGGGWVAACGTSESTPLFGGEGGNGAGGSVTNTAGSAGESFDAGGGCLDDGDCDGGVCLPDGTCCESESVCGSTCCGASEICLFNQCVVPGDPCLGDADCPEDEYCEPALGEADAGVVDAGDPDAHCTQPLPPNGRCLPRPPVCDGDAGPDASDGGCIPPCEYQPEVGELHPVVEWHWSVDPPASSYLDALDVWATPAVARIYDANCDGEVNLADPPNVIFVSNDVKATCCSCSSDPVSTCRTGVLRLLDGRSGEEIWSLDKPLDDPHNGQYGFNGLSVAVGDIDGDESLDIVAMSGGGFIAMIDASGQVQRVSDERVGGWSHQYFGWGGGISLGDMDNDGSPEIAFGPTLYETTGNAITRLWIGSAGWGGQNGGGPYSAISHFVDLDLAPDGHLELQAGRTAYRKDGSMLWNNTSVPDGFSAIADFDGNGTPEVVLISGGYVRILNGADGQLLIGPWVLPGSAHGGPPTVADFDGDGTPEIGVAQQDLYSMVEVDMDGPSLSAGWSQTTHDRSSSVTGSSVFDFEGDGKAEVVYNDECYLWVYDGTDGTILLTEPTQSFTATEASVVADVDGDGRAEILLGANGANPYTWSCAHHDEPGEVIHGHAFPVWEPFPGGDWRGLRVLGDAENAWVGTRTLWNQHAYHVTNICDPRDSACSASAYYGQIPADETDNWTVDWLNNFRQNVQDKGLFDAPDATVALSAGCTTPVELRVSVRNLGMAGLPADVEVGVYRAEGDLLLGTVTTSHPLMPGQTEVMDFTAPGGQATTSHSFYALIHIPDPPTFHECRDDNNQSATVRPPCPE